MVTRSYILAFKSENKNVQKTVAKTPQRRRVSSVAEFGSGFCTNGRIINDNDNESLKWQLRLNISTTKARSLAQFFENLPNSH